jgi:hypothetical protein
MMTRNIDAPADAAPQFVDAEADVGGNVDELKPEVELIETASAQELEKV